MTSARTSLLAVLLLFILAACVSVNATRLGAGVIRPPVPPDHVAIYRTADQVGSPYEEVALLSGSEDYNTTEEKMYQKMREKAGELGANGIILNSMTEPTTGAKVAQVLLGTPAQRRGNAVAIYIQNRPTASR